MSINPGTNETQPKSKSKAIVFLFHKTLKALQKIGLLIYVLGHETYLIKELKANSNSTPMDHLHTILHLQI